MKNYQEQQNKFFTGPKISLAFVVALALLLGGVYLFYIYNQEGSITEEVTPETKLTEPTGYIHFIAQDKETSRSYPMLFSFAEEGFVEVPQEEGTYYADIVGSRASSNPVYIQAPYKKSEEDDRGYPYEEGPFLAEGDKQIEIPVINPQNTRWSEENSAYLFTGLGSEFVANTPDDELFAFHNYSYPRNWSIYMVREKQASISDVEEVVTGVQPAWSPNENIFYYLNDPGIRAYDMETQRDYLLAEMEERLPTTNSSLEISQDGTRLYVLSSVAVHPNDSLFVLEIAENDPLSLTFLDKIDLPDAGGTYTDLTISPDGNHAGFVEYNEDELTMYFKIIYLNQKSPVPETVFTWDNLSDKYYPHAEPRWIEDVEFTN